MRNSILKKLQRFAKDPVFSIKRKVVNTFPNVSPDKWFLQVKFYKYMGYKLDLKHPKTFNEKLQWLKLYDRNPLYTTLVDKYRVKQYVAEKIGEEYIIPTLAVYKSVDEIDLDKLPDQFVLKCNHDSGSIVICRDKSTFDLAAAKEKLNRALGYNYYLNSREWPYNNVQRCIIAEQYLMSDVSISLSDYKFFCFNGEPRVMYIGSDKSESPTTDFFDMDFNHLPIKMVDPNAEICPQKPREFNLLYQLAKQLSKPAKQVRVDFYVINGRVYFGEFTFFHTGGFTEVKPAEWNKRMGDWIRLK